MKPITEFLVNNHVKGEKLYLQPEDIQKTKDFTGKFVKLKYKGPLDRLYYYIIVKIKNVTSKTLDSFYVMSVYRSQQFVFKQAMNDNWTTCNPLHTDTWEIERFTSEDFDYIQMAENVADIEYTDDGKNKFNVYPNGTYNFTYS